MDQQSQKDYYSLLGIDRTATVDQIKNAYKEIARVYHPDSNFYSEIVAVPLKPDEEKVFRVLTQAYNTLSNPDKRKDYDKTLPPMLKGWDTDTESEFHQPRRASSGPYQQVENRRVSEAYGVFGNVRTERRSAMDIALEKEIDQHSKIIRKGVRMGFIRRILLLFGF